MHTLDDLDRAIIDHIKAHPRAQTVADLHQALQASPERPTREQVRWRVRGLHAAGHLTCEAHTSPHVRGVTYAYTLRPAFLTPTMTDAERVAAIRARVAAIRAKEPHAQR